MHADLVSLAFNFDVGRGTDLWTVQPSEVTSLTLVQAALAADEPSG